MKTLKIIACASVLMTNFAMAEVAVIVNQANGTTLDKAQIARIFMGKQREFDSGIQAFPLNQRADSAIRGEFEKKVLKKSAARLKAYWSKMLFAGRGTAPVEASAKEVLDNVKNDPKAIGYIDKDSVTSEVKVVAIF